jgi:hypothetical protein
MAVRRVITPLSRPDVPKLFAMLVSRVQRNFSNRSGVKMIF